MINEKNKVQVTLNTKAHKIARIKKKSKKSIIQIVNSKIHSFKCWSEEPEKPISAESGLFVGLLIHCATYFLKERVSAKIHAPISAKPI